MKWILFAVVCVYAVFGSPNSVVLPPCNCFEEGNYYTPNSANGCRSFFQRTAFLPPKEQNCSKGLMFDIHECVCNWPRNMTCPPGCPGGGHIPSTSPYSCYEKGNTYRPVAGTGCTRFTQETAILPPVEHPCPTGLQFDIKECVCNWPRDTECHE